MPLVAAAGGIASAIAGASAIGTATGLAAVVAGVQIVSGVAAALGAVTGNKTLMKVGMVGAVVAGGVSLANNLSGGGLLGSASQPADMMGSVTDSALTGGAADVASTHGLSAAIDAAEAGAVSSVGDVGNISGVSGATSAADATGVARDAVGAVSPSVDAVTSNAVAPVDPNANWAAEMTAKTTLDTNSVRMPGAAGSGGTSGGLLASFQDFMRKNPELTKVGAKAVGGMGEAYMQAEAAKEKQRLIDEQRRRYNQSITNQRSR